MSYTYFCVWPILDVDRPRSALIAEACGDLDIMAQLAGARIVGAPEWTVSEDRLVCLAPARPASPDDEVPRLPGEEVPPVVIAQIEALAHSSLSISAIARLAGVDRKTAAKYASRAAA